MYPIVRNNSLPQLNGTNGLNGWFGRMVKKLIGLALNVVGEVPIIGGTIQKELTKVVDQLMDDSSFFQRKAPEFEPSPAEAAIIENWATTKLNPFYKVLVTQLSNAFAMADFNAQLAQINNVMLKICVLKQYYTTNETVGLSVDAVQSRMEVITRILLPVENLITKSIAEYDTVVNLTPYVFAVTTANATQFAPLIARLVPQQFTCNKYVATDKPNLSPGKITLPTKDLPIKVTTPIKTTVPVKLPVTANPATPVKPTTPANPVLPVNPVSPTKPTTPANPVLPVNTTPTNPVLPVNPATPVKPTTPAPTTPVVIVDDIESAIPSKVKSYFTVKNIGIGLLALLALRALTKKSKKK